MDMQSGSKQVSFLRNLVEDIPEDGLGAEDEWSWNPEVSVDRDSLGAASPTTEYSSKEDDE